MLTDTEGIIVGLILTVVIVTGSVIATMIYEYGQARKVIEDDDGDDAEVIPFPRKSD